ncbi:MAG: imidazole glycerol phosphate synthase subunit HisF [Candidatus Bathyarchaeia archaeon]
MSFRRIIPCLDTTLDEAGRPTVVKGVEFEGLRYAGDPVKLARRYDDQGADEVCFLDITASVANRATTIDVVRRIAEVVSVPLCVGGGIRTLEDFGKAFEAGADKVSVNTAAVKNPQLIKEAAETYGRRVVAAIDCKRRFETRADRVMVTVETGAKAWYEVVIYGGRQAIGLDAVEWARRVQSLGASEILLTSKDRDGTRNGYDLPITRAIAEAVGIPVIASGGVGNPQHMYEAFHEAKADACLAASIFHYGECTVGDVKRFLKEKGVSVRL